MRRVPSPPDVAARRLARQMQKQAMPFSSDPFDILLGHNRWANRELLIRCGDLSDSQFHRCFEIGPGSLHDTLTHIIGAIFRWSDRIGGSPLRPSIEGRAPGDPAPMTRRPVQELLALNDQACADFAAAVTQVRPQLAEARDWTLGPDTYRFTVSAAVIHVTNHGMHHRAQGMNMLRHLGKPMNADLDELEWQVAGEP
jgi:uncharacterized damage-inducible protein DinB